MANPMSAMVTWVGALARGGILRTNEEEAGAELAFAVLGEDGLVQLREWFGKQPKDVVTRERRGAIHACVWMVQADREVHDEEVRWLESVIANSDLPAPVQSELLAALDEPLGPEDIADELTQPGLRELMLALTWRVALADERIDDLERSAYQQLAEAFQIAIERADAIRDAMTAHGG